MSQIPVTEEQDMSFAPLGAELAIETHAQNQQVDNLLDEALELVEQPMGIVVDEFPSIYDDKLRQLIDAVPVE